MMDNVLEIYNKLEEKVAKRRGRKTSPKKKPETKKQKIFRKKTQISKEHDKTTSKYQELRKKVLKLKADETKLKDQMEKTEKEFETVRTEMLKLKKVLDNLDLIDSNQAIFYKNDVVDVGYVIDGEPHYVDVNDAGDCTTTPMKDYIKELKKKRREETAEANDTADADDADDQPILKDEESDECENCESMMADIPTADEIEAGLFDSYRPGFQTQTNE